MTYHCSLLEFFVTSCTGCTIWRCTCWNTHVCIEAMQD